VCVCVCVKIHLKIRSASDFFQTRNRVSKADFNMQRSDINEQNMSIIERSQQKNCNKELNFAVANDLFSRLSDRREDKRKSDGLINGRGRNPASNKANK